MYDIITFGSATMDIVVSPKKVTVLKYGQSPSDSHQICFPFGSKIDIESMRFSSGGGGTNTAATFANQGFKTAFVGAVGRDSFGIDLLKELKATKIDTKFTLSTYRGATNSTIVILNGANDTTNLTYRGASEMLSKDDIPFAKLKAPWIYLAPLTGNMALSFEYMVHVIKKNKAKVAVNPSIAQLSLPNFANIAKNINVLVMNQEEASFLTKVSADKEEELFSKLHEICEGIIIVTKGGEGVVVSDHQYLYSATPEAERTVVDTTGAGDAFGSGFLCEFIREKGDIEKAIQFGLANSAANIAQFGAKVGLLKKGQPFNRVSVTKEKI